jgi:4-hydroxy-tetrahydrodipicolinate synthase
MKDLGVLTPIVTPCSRAGEPDADGLRAVCDDMLGAGVQALFVVGSTGRGPWFGRDECATICQTVAEHIASDTPLFAGCIASGLTDMLDNARAMADAGAQIAVVTAPGYFGYSPAEVESIFLKFADKSPLPVVIYDIPQFTKMKLGGEMVRRMADHGNIVGFKDSTADGARFGDLLEMLKDKDDFTLLQGKESLLADAILAGASGFVVSLLHIDPRPFVVLYDAARSGDAERAYRIQERITEMMMVVVEAFEEQPQISTLNHLLNYALRQRGVCENILLAHEGECPPVLAERAEKMLAICEGVI